MPRSMYCCSLCVAVGNQIYQNSRKGGNGETPSNISICSWATAPKRPESGSQPCLTLQHDEMASEEHNQWPKSKEKRSLDTLKHQEQDCSFSFYGGRLKPKAQTSTVRHKASYLMQDTPKSQKTVRKNSNGRADKKKKRWEKQNEYWKKKFPVWGWRTGTDKDNRVLFRMSCIRYEALPYHTCLCVKGKCILPKHELRCRGHI